MSFQERACHTALCDDCGDGWEEGPWHFDSREELLSSLKSYGWVVAGDRVLCQSCSEKADCEATGHQWGDWDDRVMEGVPYRYRWCEHCGHSETDPPFRELSQMMHAARVVNGLEIDDAQP